MRKAKAAGGDSSGFEREIRSFPNALFQPQYTAGTLGLQGDFCEYTK